MQYILTPCSGPKDDKTFFGVYKRHVRLATCQSDRKV